jgi:hypothetical protein
MAMVGLNFKLTTAGSLRDILDRGTFLLAGFRPWFFLGLPIIAAAISIYRNTLDDHYARLPNEKQMFTCPSLCRGALYSQNSTAQRCGPYL